MTGVCSTESSLEENLLYLIIDIFLFLLVFGEFGDEILVDIVEVTILGIYNYDFNLCV